MRPAKCAIFASPHKGKLGQHADYCVNVIPLRPQSVRDHRNRKVTRVGLLLLLVLPGSSRRAATPVLIGVLLRKAPAIDGGAARVPHDVTDELSECACALHESSLSGQSACGKKQQKNAT